MDESRKVDIAGKVVESDPPRRLVLSWARPEEFADDTKHSRVTFEIEPQGSVVRLMVMHEDLDEKMAKGVSSGWPKILSNLKTMLETGSALPGSTK